MGVKFLVNLMWTNIFHAFRWLSKISKIWKTDVFFFVKICFLIADLRITENLNEIKNLLIIASYIETIVLLKRKVFSWADERGFGGGDLFRLLFSQSKQLENHSKVAEHKSKTFQDLLTRILYYPLFDFWPNYWTN